MVEKKSSVKKPFYKKWWFIGITLFFLIGIIGIITESDESKAERAAEEQAKVDAKELKESIGKVGTVTPEEFNKLKKGMSYDEVKEVVRGKAKSESINQFDESLASYDFDGENGVEDDAYVSLLFNNGKLDTIMEFGLLTEIMELTEEEQKQADKNFADIQEKVQKDMAKSNIEKIITDKLGTTTNMKKDLIVELNVFALDDAPDGSKNIILTMNASENMTNNMTRKGMWIDSVKILEPLSKVSGVENISIEWLFPLVDQYGDETDGRIMMFDFPKETFDKVNWDNFNKDNLPNVSTDYFEHPALGK